MKNLIDDLFGNEIKLLGSDKPKGGGCLVVLFVVVLILACLSIFAIAPLFEANRLWGLLPFCILGLGVLVLVLLGNRHK